MVVRFGKYYKDDTFRRRALLFARHLVVCAASLAPISPSAASATETRQTTPIAIHGGNSGAVVAIYPASNFGERRPSGAGFVITANGHILTAKHILEIDDEDFAGAPFLVRLGGSEEVYQAKVVDLHEYYDAAILKITRKHRDNAGSGSEGAAQSQAEKLDDFPTLSFGKGLTTSLQVIGHPGEERPAEFQLGNHSLKQIDRWNRIIVTPEFERGESGGPVISETGHVIGIALAKAVYTATGYVLPVRLLTDFLKWNGIVVRFEDTSMYRDHEHYAMGSDLSRLEAEFHTLKDTVAGYLVKLAELEDELTKLKSRVEWGTLVCHAGSADTPNSASDQTLTAQVATLSQAPRRALIVWYHKASDDLWDAEGDFTAEILPIMKNEARVEAQHMDLLLATPHPREFESGKYQRATDGSKPISGGMMKFDFLEKIIQTRLRLYNKKFRDRRKHLKLTDIKELELSVYSLDGTNRMRKFGFQKIAVEYSSVADCDTFVRVGGA